MKRSIVAIIFSSLVAANVYAAEESKKEDSPKVTFGGFIDTYYAYDFDRPPARDRSFTTQPARHNEFNVNLAYLDAKLEADRIRGRLALQAGTSVQANYAAEPTVGQFSGPNLARHIQEGVVGYRVTDRLWIDGGIYLSHIGFESWISKDNWTYTRSLAADYSPYYQTGVKATYQWCDSFSTQFHVLNGWQNISDNNGNKAIGMQFAYTPSDKISLTYNNFLGNEVASRRRFFNDFIFKLGLTEKLQFAALYDVGFQQTPEETANSIWQTYGLFLKYQFTPKFSLTLRGEQYFDKDQVIVTTNSEHGFQTTSASINADVALHKHLLWRTELRGFWSKDSIYPTKTGTSPDDGLVVTSLSLWL